MTRRFAVKILAKHGEEDFRLYKAFNRAQYRYFRAFAAVAEQQLVKTPDGEFVHLVGCSLYEVATKNMERAKWMIDNNEARRLRDSDDPGSGSPIEIPNLFRKYH